MTLAVLALAGVLTASGATTGALWNAQAEVDGPVSIVAGDLDLTDCGFLWAELAGPTPRASGGDVTGLSQGAFRFMPGDKLVLRQCVQAAVEGDNLTVNLKVSWADAPSLVDLEANGVDLSSSSYRIEPVWAGATPEPWRHESTVTAIGQQAVAVEAATSQNNTAQFAPANPQRRLAKWNVVITLAYRGLPTGSPYVFPPVGSPTPMPTSTPSNLILPGFEIVAEQTRGGVGF